MHPRLEADRNGLPRVLEQACAQAIQSVEALPDKTVAPRFPETPLATLPEEGRGASEALRIFSEAYAPHFLAMPGPRFFGFVIGGTTPAALAGDWLTSALDQNAFGIPGNVDRQIEREAIAMTRELLGLPDSFAGVMASGATMATLGNLSAAREWAAQQQGLDTAQNGVDGLELAIYCGTAHASVYKALSMLGLGRSRMTPVGRLPDREAIDLRALEVLLQKRKCPSIVVASMCTVDSGDCDDLAALAQLRKQYGFWLHIDGAIAAPAAALPEFADRFVGMDEADSITLDCHKWFNVPYDAAIILCQQPRYLYNTFAQSASPGDMPDSTPFFNLAPEGSRRLRALPLWMSLMAYGKEGYRDIFRRNCAHARLAYDRLSASGRFVMLAEPRFNVVCFTLPDAKAATVQAFAERVRDTGKTFTNVTQYRGETPALRLCFSNWSTEESHVNEAIDAILACLD